MPTPPASLERGGPRTPPASRLHIEIVDGDPLQARTLQVQPGPDAATPPGHEGGVAAIPQRTVTLELDLTLEEVERRYLSAHLARGGRDLATTAAALGISRKTLWEKRRRYGL